MKMDCVCQHDLYSTETGKGRRFGTRRRVFAMCCEKREPTGSSKYLGKFTSKCVIQLSLWNAFPFLMSLSPVSTTLNTPVVLQDPRMNPQSPEPYSLRFNLAFVFRIFLTFEFTKNQEAVESILH